MPLTDWVSLGAFLTFFRVLEETADDVDGRPAPHKENSQLCMDVCTIRSYMFIDNQDRYSTWLDCNVENIQMKD